MSDELRNMFEENCIIVKDGKKYLNELGSLIICFTAVSLLRSIFDELGIKESNNNG